MKSHLLVLLILALSLFTAHANYWVVEEPVSGVEIETSSLEALDLQIQQARGLEKMILQLSKPFVAVSSFFSQMNIWFGEFIFVMRVLLWFSLTMGIQIAYVLFWYFILKVVVKIWMFALMLMQSDEIGTDLQNEALGVKTRLKSTTFGMLRNIQKFV